MLEICSCRKKPATLLTRMASMVSPFCSEAWTKLLYDLLSFVFLCQRCHKKLFTPLAFRTGFLMLANLDGILNVFRRGSQDPRLRSHLLRRTECWVSISCSFQLSRIENNGAPAVIVLLEWQNDCWKIVINKVLLYTKGPQRSWKFRDGMRVNEEKTMVCSLKIFLGVGVGDFWPDMRLIMWRATNITATFVCEWPCHTFNFIWAKSVHWVVKERGSLFFWFAHFQLNRQM